MPDSIGGTTQINGRSAAPTAELVGGSRGEDQGEVVSDQHGQVPGDEK